MFVYPVNLEYFKLIDLFHRLKYKRSTNSDLNSKHRLLPEARRTKPIIYIYVVFQCHVKTLISIYS